MTYFLRSTIDLTHCSIARDARLDLFAVGDTIENIGVLLREATEVMYSSFQGLFCKITSQHSNSRSQILRSPGRKGVTPLHPTALYSGVTVLESNSYMAKVEDCSLGALDAVS